MARNKAPTSVNAPATPPVTTPTSYTDPLPPPAQTAPNIGWADWTGAGTAQKSDWSNQWQQQAATNQAYNQAMLERIQAQQAQQAQQQQAAAAASYQQSAPPVATPLNPKAVPVSPTGVLQATKDPTPGSIVTTKKAGYVVQPGAQRIAGFRYPPYVEEQFRAQERQRAANQQLARVGQRPAAAGNSGDWGY